MRGLLHGVVGWLALSLLLCVFPRVLDSATPQGTGQSRPGVVAPTVGARSSGTGLLKVLVTSFSGAPLRRAVVNIEGRSSGATTDPDGRVSMTIPAGRWVLTAVREGYLAMHSGQQSSRELPRPFVIEPGQTLTVALRLPRCGVLGGRVTDEMGEPLPSVRVRALRTVYVQGRRTQVPAGEADSNAAGLYSIAGLVPGSYTLRATRFGETVGGDANGFAPGYYPATWDASQAAPIDLGIEQELTGLDIRLFSGRVAQINGRVLDSRGRPATGTVTLYERIAADQQDVRAVAMAPVGGGIFVLTGIAPGDYVLRAQIASASTTGTTTIETAALSLSVNQTDVNGLMLTAGMGASINISVEVDGLGGATGAPNFALTAVSTDGGGSGATSAVQRPGLFRLTGLGGPVQIRAVGLPPEWMLKSVVIGARDCTDTPYDFRGNETVSGRVVITNRIAEVTGTVTDDRGQATADYAVVVFPADRRRWIGAGRSMQAARADQQGRFSIKGLPAGDYVAVVSIGLDESEWTNPGFLEQLASRATPFTLDDGATKTLDLKLPRGSSPDQAGARESRR